MPAFFTRLLIPTLRNVPAEAEVISHRLMLRAGMIRKVAAGIYTYLPLGLRVIRKIESIVREEMNRAGGQELLMPSVLPAELWKETGRWEFYGKELLRIKDRHQRDFCYGPTHEEIITDLVRKEVRSYRSLPLIFYQIQTKFRDEIRPRFGLMRGREFIMKDAYSFDATMDGAEKSYQVMMETYSRIFERCGLNFRAVEADTGTIGGASSHEFSVLAESGEDSLVICNACQYAANIEKAVSRQLPPERNVRLPEKIIEKVRTPGQKGVDEVAKYLNISPQRIIKTLLYLADRAPVAVLVRGDFEINEIFLKKALNAAELTLVPPERVAEVTGAPAGFAGPVGLGSVRIVADDSVRELEDAVTGANEADAHFIHVWPDRDFKVESYLRLRKVREGEYCSRCGSGVLSVTRGIEVGHVFLLGEKYSTAMSARFLNPDGKEEPYVMGCFGIGIGRTGAAAIEQNHDEKGIIWPLPIAPYHAVILPLNQKSHAVAEASARLAEELESIGMEVLVDDRPERPGVKFNDSDLIGFPFQVIVGDKGAAEGTVEIKNRRTGKTDKMPLRDARRFFSEIQSRWS